MESQTSLILNLDIYSRKISHKDELDIIEFSLTVNDWIYLSIF